MWGYSPFLPLKKCIIEKGKVDESKKEEEKRHVLIPHSFKLAAGLSYSS